MVDEPALGVADVSRRILMALAQVWCSAITENSPPKAGANDAISLARQRHPSRDFRSTLWDAPRRSPKVRESHVQSEPRVKGRLWSETFAHLRNALLQSSAARLLDALRAAERGCSLLSVSPTASEPGS
jgi:hypothetical protein